MDTWKHVIETIIHKLKEEVRKYEEQLKEETLPDRRKAIRFEIAKCYHSIHELDRILRYMQSEM